MIEKANPKLDLREFLRWLKGCGVEEFAIGPDAWDSDAVARWLRSTGLRRPRVGISMVACYDEGAGDWRHCYFGADFWVSRFVRDTLEMFHQQGLRAMSRAETIKLIEQIRRAS